MDIYIQFYYVGLEVGGGEVELEAVGPKVDWTFERAFTIGHSSSVQNLNWSGAGLYFFAGLIGVTADGL